MSDATFATPDLTTFARLDELGLEVTGQRLDPDRAVLACRVVERDEWCRRCGEEGVPRDTVTRELAHEPLGWRPTTLVVTVRRYRCCGCGHVWRQDTSRAAAPRAKLSRRGLSWALHGSWSSLGMLLAGGGVGPPVIGILAGAVGRWGVDRQPRWLQRPRPRTVRALGRAWPALFVLSLANALFLVVGSVILVYTVGLHAPTVFEGSFYLSVVLLVMHLVAAPAHDADRSMAEEAGVPRHGHHEAAPAARTPRRRQRRPSPARGPGSGESSSPRSDCGPARRACPGDHRRGGPRGAHHRRLAGDVGVKAPSLYNHIAGKDELVDGALRVMRAQFRLRHRPPSTGNS